MNGRPEKSNFLSVCREASPRKPKAFRFTGGKVAFLICIACLTACGCASVVEDEKTLGTQPREVRVYCEDARIPCDLITWESLTAKDLDAALATEDNVATYCAKKWGMTMNLHMWLNPEVTGHISLVYDAEHRTVLGAKFRRLKSPCQAVYERSKKIMRVTVNGEPVYAGKVRNDTLSASVATVTKRMCLRNDFSWRPYPGELKKPFGDERALAVSRAEFDGARVESFGKSDFAGALKPASEGSIQVDFDMLRILLVTMAEGYSTLSIVP